jgi:hypothetical protein
MYKQKELNHDIELILDGLGIVIYSEGMVKDIEEGVNYFNMEYATSSQVALHIKKGDIVGFSTGSGGVFNLKFRTGYPNEEIDKDYPISIRLAIDVRGGKISVIDLFWLMEWSNECPPEQQILIDDGIYHMTVSTAKPISGIWGDGQDIYIFLNQIAEMPELMWSGVPELFI